MTNHKHISSERRYMKIKLNVCACLIGVPWTCRTDYICLDNNERYTTNIFLGDVWHKKNR